MAGFKQGVSGNPAERPKGVVTQRTRFLKGLKATGKSELIYIAEIFKMASEGHAGCLGITAERLWPKTKLLMPAVNLPKTDDKESAAKSVVDALQAGTLSPDQAVSCMNVLRQAAELTELEEIRQRLTQLENQS